MLKAANHHGGAKAGELGGVTAAAPTPALNLTHIKDQDGTSIIKPGEVRVDVLLISKVKQQQGLKRGGRGEGRKIKGKKQKTQHNKTFKSFLKSSRSEI